MASSVKYSGSLYNNRHTFQVAGEQLSNEAKEATLDAAILYQESIENFIAGDGMGLWNLDTLWYKKKKAMLGGSPNSPYIYKGDLLGHLTTEITQDGNLRFRAWAGFSNGSHYSGYSISQLVDKLDSARPLISPAFERVSPQINKILNSIGKGVLRG